MSNTDDIMPRRVTAEDAYKPKYTDGEIAAARANERRKVWEEAAEEMKPGLDAIERLVFDIPAPNQWTPQIVQIVIATRARLRALAAEKG